MMEERVDPRRAQVAQVGGRGEKCIRVRFSAVTNPAPSPQSALGSLVPVRPSEARAVKLICRNTTRGGVRGNAAKRSPDAARRPEAKKRGPLWDTTEDRGLGRGAFDQGSPLGAGRAEEGQPLHQPSERSARAPRGGFGADGEV